MAKTCITVLCGIPGSGKTAIARKLCVDAAEENFQLSNGCQTDKNMSSIRITKHFHHVCYDKLIPRALELQLINSSPEDEVFPILC